MYITTRFFRQGIYFLTEGVCKNKLFTSRSVVRNFFRMPPITGASDEGTQKLVQQMVDENKVMIFSKSYCPFCKKVKEIFKSMNQDARALELDLEANGDAIQSSLLAMTNQKTVPNVFINQKHLGGCSDTEKAFADGTLAAMLEGQNYDYDVFVVGGGSGGLACSKEAAELGMKSAVADFVTPSPHGTKWGIGGTCVNVGCIPKKLMHQAALLGEAIEDSRHFGWQVEEKTKHDWGTMVQAIQDHVRSLNWGYKVQLRSKQVKYYNKFAQLLDKNTIKLTASNGKEETVTARNIVLAPGGRPFYPDVEGAKECCITSDDIFSLPYNPGKTLFVGASYIALECAGFLRGIGLDVSIMVRSIFLRGFDQEVAGMIGTYMEKQSGIRMMKKCVPIKFEKIEEGTPGKIKVTYKSTEDGTENSEIFDTVCLAIGRKPLTKELGLENAGVAVNEKNGFILSDDADKTSADNIFAIGDVLDGKPELTPVAIQAGKLLARRLFAGAKDKCNYDFVPTTVFTPLEYGSCGYSEEAAIEKYGEENIEVYHSNFTPLEFTVPHRPENECYAKLICNKADEERVVGFHVLGPNAGEVTQGFSLAFKLGATKHHFDDLIGIHPTNAEVFTTLNVTKSSGVSALATGC